MLDNTTRRGGGGRGGGEGGGRTRLKQRNASYQPGVNAYPVKKFGLKIISVDLSGFFIIFSRSFLFR